MKTIELSDEELWDIRNCVTLQWERIGSDIGEYTLAELLAGYQDEFDEWIRLRNLAAKFNKTIQLTDWGLT